MKISDLIFILISGEAESIETQDWKANTESQLRKRIEFINRRQTNR